MNQNSEQIDRQLTACGRMMQNKYPINLYAVKGAEGAPLTVYEGQLQVFGESKLKYLNGDPLPFAYEGTREVESCLSVADKLEETITNSLQQAEALRQNILKKRLRESC